MAEMREPRLLRAIATLLVTALLCAAAGARTIYVDDDAPGFGDGSSWETAYKYLQDALAEAKATEGPVEIRVAQGLYRPDRGANVVRGDRQASFRLSSEVTIRGGYDGRREGSHDTRDVALYESVLCGDLNGDDVRVEELDILAVDPRRADNSYHVVTISGEDTDVVIDGFTITGGRAEPNIPRRRGGPVPTGGGLRNGGSPTLLSCTFTRNLASEGGALYSFAGVPTLVGCIFHDNVACEEQLFLPDATAVGIYGNGGAIYADSDMTLEDCTFYDNLAAFGGAIHVSSRNSLELTRCAFTSNRATRVGGGIQSEWENSFRLTGCLFKGNSAGRNGGAIFSWAGVFRMTGCVLAGNSAGRNGGAICAHMTDFVLDRCTSAGNRALAGAPLAFESSGVGPIPVRLFQCVLWDSGNQLAVNDDIRLTVAYSDVLHGWPGEGNIDVDPLFANPGFWDPNGTPDDPYDDFWVDGDYHLKSQAGRWDPATASWVVDEVTSPCIDAGDPDSPIGHEPFPNGGRINMGAYGGTAEAGKSWFGEPSCETIIAGDINGDCRVDFKDFQILASHWLQDRRAAPSENGRVEQ